MGQATYLLMEEEITLQVCCNSSKIADGGEQAQTFKAIIYGREKKNII